MGDEGSIPPTCIDGLTGPFVSSFRTAPVRKTLREGCDTLILYFEKDPEPAVVWHGGVLNLKTCAPPIKPIMECWYCSISQAIVELKSNVSLISRRAMEAVSHI
jgi:hypothetical protein